MSNRWLPPLVFLGLTLIVRADGPADNRVDNVRPVPPPGIGISDADRKVLQDGVAELGKQIDGLRDSLKTKPALLAVLPDVQIYDKAVRWALRHNEFYEAREVAVAKKLLAQGLARADSLRQAARPGTRRQDWSFVAICRRSTDRFNLTGWLCRPHSRRTHRIGSGSTSGAMDGERS